MHSVVLFLYSLYLGFWCSSAQNGPTANYGHGEVVESDECPLKPSTTVAYYGGHGATDDCQDWEHNFFSWWASSEPAIKVEKVLPSKLHRGGLQNCKNLRVWLQPGGNAYDQQNSLGPKGKAALLAYIQHGHGAYVGTCAGWYVSASDYWWEGKHYQWPDMLGIFPTVEGSITDIWDDAVPPGYALTHVQSANQSLHVLYWGGPTRDWHHTPAYNGSGHRVLTFTDVNTKDGQGHPPAAIADGRKLFLSVHLEAYEGHPGGVKLTPKERLANYRERARLINAVAETTWDIPTE